MGQIIIDIPVDENLQFEVSSTKEYKELKKYLNSMCLIENPSEGSLDYLDGIDALAALERNNFVRWEDVKHRL